MLKAIIAAIAVYLLIDVASDFVLAPIGMTYLHAFLAMLFGMAAGGYLAGRSFITVAIVINVLFSGLTYLMVANMRDQSLVELILEQHPMISAGSFAGAIIGAWLGRMLAIRLHRSAG